MTAFIIDVRSQGEFVKGHIPGAISIPLLDNRARHEVGLAYKTQGFSQAFHLALERTGPHLASYVKQGEALEAKRLLIYCARGGMRSRSMAWLYTQAGLQVDTLPGGYKQYRQAVLQFFEHPFNLHVVGGYTGVGKTEYLYQLQKQGEQIIDLEALAEHRGSAFGRLGEQQPSSELFENRLYESLKTFNLAQPIWVEDESRLIGSCVLPHSFYHLMQKAPLNWLERPLDERVHSLLEKYTPRTPQEEERFIEQLSTLKKRLGLEKIKKIAIFLEQKDYCSIVKELLPYYDQSYKKKLDKRSCYK